MEIDGSGSEGTVGGEAARQAMTRMGIEGLGSVGSVGEEAARR